MRVAFSCKQTTSFTLQCRWVPLFGLLLSLVWHSFPLPDPVIFLFPDLDFNLWGRNHVCGCLYSRIRSCFMAVVCKCYRNINSTLIINYIVDTFLCPEWWHCLLLFGSSQRWCQYISIIKTFVSSHGCTRSSWNRFRHRGFALWTSDA